MVRGRNSLTKKKINILGKPFIVIYDEIEDVHGIAKTDKQEIKISTEIGKEEQEETLIHEIIEVINYQLDLELPHGTIMRLSSGLYSAGVRAP